MINLFHKSLIAPTQLIIKPTYYMIGEKFCRNMLVTALPKEFGLGMLSFYTSNPKVKVFIKTSTLDFDISKALGKEHKELEDTWKKAKDPTDKEKLRKKLESLDIYIQETVSYSDRTQNLILLFSIHSETLEDLESDTKDLRNRLHTSGFKTEVLAQMQIDLFKATVPLFYKNDFSDIINYNLGVPITSNSFAGMYPYIFDTLKDPNGFVFGRERSNCGVIVWDPAYYINNSKLAPLSNRLTGNMILIGASGTGKTTDMNLIIRYFIREKMPIIWIDPENKNIHITKKYGGTFINWGTKNAIINIFDLRPISADEDEEIDAYNTELAIKNVIDEFKILIQLFAPKVSDDTLSIVGDLVIELYHRKGIHYTTDFKGLETTAYPILSDFMRLVLEKMNEETLESAKNLLFDLSVKIKPMITENSHFFDGHTTIPKESNILSFGTKILFNKSENLRNALNYLMFRYAWGLCLDESQKTAFVIDECHLMILDGVTAPQLDQFYRRSRKYLNHMVMGTQETTDFTFESVRKSGRAIFNNSTYMIIKNLQKNSVEALSTLMNLNESEKEVIQDFQRGEALFVCGKRRIPISVLATEKELLEMNPSTINSR